MNARFALLVVALILIIAILLLLADMAWAQQNYTTALRTTSTVCLGDPLNCTPLSPVPPTATATDRPTPAPVEICVIPQGYPCAYITPSWGYYRGH